MKKRILLLMVFTVFLFGCERTEKPEGWDEKNKKPEIEKDITEELEAKYESILNELKSKTPEDLKSDFGENPLFQDLYNYIHDELSKVAKSKDEVDAFLKDEKDEIKEFFDEYILNEEDDDSIDDFKDKIEAKIENGDIKFDDRMSFDDFEQIIFDNIDLYKPNMSSSEKSKFAEENHEFLNEFYMELLDDYRENNSGKNSSDSLIEEAVEEVRSMNEDEIDLIFGDYPTYESFKIYIHSYISGAEPTMNTIEIEKIMDENEEYISEAFEEIFKN